MNLSELLDECLAMLPMGWPLYSSAPQHPWHQFTEESFYACGERYTKHLPIKAGLPFHFYHQLFNAGLISKDNVHRALLEYFPEELPKEHEEQLLAFITRKRTMYALEQHERWTDDGQHGPYHLLSARLSAQRRLHLYQDVLDHILRFALYVFSIKKTFSQTPSPLFSHFYALKKKQYPKLHWPDCENALDAIEYFFSALCIPEGIHREYLIEIIQSLWGIMSHTHWLHHFPNHPDNSMPHVHSQEWIAIWLCQEYILCQDQYPHLSTQAYLPTEPMNPAPWLKTLNSIPAISAELATTQQHQLREALGHFNLWRCRLIWQSAYEQADQAALLKKLSKKNGPKLRAPIEAQWVFCIDTRSALARSALEKHLNVETFGAAGFFGMIFNARCEDGHQTTWYWQSPAIVNPDWEVRFEKPSGKSKWRDLSLLFENLKKHLLAPLALFEWIGLWFLPYLLLRNIACTTPSTTSWSLPIFPDKDIPVLATQAAAFLKLIDLKHFAHQVVLCAHRAHTTNNSVHSLLECGACGAHAGELNALVATALLNDPRVRAALATAHEIHIPEKTTFFTVVHNTTQQCFESSTHPHAPWLKKANQALKNILPIHQQRLPTKALAHYRALHWAELIPELGLNDHQALIIAPRWLTEYQDLDSRCFLHSYVPQQDPHGEILSAIFQGPVHVGLWINGAYYFAATDPKFYSSGNKAIHNPVGNFSVMEGNLSDFRFGLSQQSLTFQDQYLHHPQRLHVIVYAQKKIVDQVLDALPHIKAFFAGKWLHLTVIEPRDTDV